MVDPLIVIGGSVAAYLALKPKKLSPEESQEIIEKAPPQVVERATQQAITKAAPKKIGTWVKIEKLEEEREYSQPGKEIRIVPIPTNLPIQNVPPVVPVRYG